MPQIKILKKILMFFGYHLRAGQLRGPNFFEDHCLGAPGLRKIFQIYLNILSVLKIKINISARATFQSGS